MGLKSHQPNCLNYRPWRLKSDQNVIEMQEVMLQEVMQEWLKSDQNGIEMIRGSRGLLNLINVKIRPKWDWNPHTQPHHLRDNQVKIRPKWDWNEWFVRPVEVYESVKIRPKWDWNCSRGGVVNDLVQLKSDQNGIEIRSSACTLWTCHG